MMPENEDGLCGQIIDDVAAALNCEPDNEAILVAIDRWKSALYKIAQGGNRVRMDWPASGVLDRESMCDLAKAALKAD